jgi:mono/diheme cytochrome c family protein
MKTPLSFLRVGCLGLVIGGVLGLSGGCTQPSAVTFAPRDGFAEMPAKHQDQIRAHLERYFGPPIAPRLMTVAAQQPESPQEGAGPLLEDKVDRLHLMRGLAVYTRQCAGCHGPTGNGQGTAAPNLDPAPRDYRLGKFKFISTPRDSKPRREDLARIIRRGAKGTSMPAFRWMPDEDLQAVIDYVILLSQRGELEYRLMRIASEQLGEEDNIDAELVAEQAAGIAAAWDEAKSQVVLPITAEPARTAETVRLGAKAFVELNCFKCHGKDGSGNRQFNVGKDDWGRTAFAADLTSGMLHGGRRPVDIYRRIYSGINGTPMPAFNRPEASKQETEAQRSDTIWHLTHFVTSIVEGKELPMDVIEEAIRSLPQAPPEAASGTTGGGL